jgi:hypothetical protein
VLARLHGDPHAGSILPLHERYVVRDAQDNPVVRPPVRSSIKVWSLQFTPKGADRVNFFVVITSTNLYDHRNEEQGLRLRIGRVWAVGAALAPLVVIGVAHVAYGVKVSDVTRDVANFADLPPWMGSLSSLGILGLWTSAVAWAVAALAGDVSGRNARVGPHQAQGADSVAFAWSSSAFSAYLALDDLFQIHEYVAPRYLGVPEKAVLIVLAAAALAYAWTFRAALVRRSFGVALLAATALTASMGVDVIDERLWRLGQWVHLLEDGLKWVGITAWATFSIERALASLRER